MTKNGRFIINFPETALIIVDAQRDFCPGGALAVKNGDEVIPLLNELAGVFAEKGAKVIATQDWHPEGHVSFASSQRGKEGAGTFWPDHCLWGSPGADFHEKLDTKPVNLIVRKGFRKNLDSYSAFFENDRKTPTGLLGYLESLGVQTVVLGGLATDYCVFYSAMDARASGFRTILAADACRGVNYPEGSVEKAFETMEKAGVLTSGHAELLA